MVMLSALDRSTGDVLANCGTTVVLPEKPPMHLHRHWRQSIHTRPLTSEISTLGFAAAGHSAIVPILTQTFKNIALTLESAIGFTTAAADAAAGNRRICSG